MLRLFFLHVVVCRKTREENERNLGEFFRLFLPHLNKISAQKKREIFSAQINDGVDSYPTKGGEKVRRNDRRATDFNRVGDFFCRFGVYRGGVSGDWDQREQRRYAICACIYIISNEV